MLTFFLLQTYTYNLRGTHYPVRKEKSFDFSRKTYDKLYRQETMDLLLSQRSYECRLPTNLSSNAAVTIEK